MGISQVLFGTTRTIPQKGETGWGAETTSLINDLAKFCNGIGTLVNDIAALSLPPEDSVLADGATLTKTRVQHMVSGSGGAVTLDTSTAIANGSVDGELLQIRGTDSTNTVYIQDGANVSLNGDILFRNGTALLLIWDVDNDLWNELSRSE